MALRQFAFVSSRLDISWSGLTHAARSQAQTKPALKLYRDIAREVRAPRSSIEPCGSEARTACQVPRILNIFDIELPVPVVRGSQSVHSLRGAHRVLTFFLCRFPRPCFADQVRSRIAEMFRANGYVEDERVVKMLVTKG